MAAGLGFNAFWTFIANTAISYAVSSISNKLFGPKAQNNSPTYAFGRLQTQTNSGMVMALIYGRVKCAGNMIWASDAGKTQHKIVSFGVGKNKGINDVKFNDMAVYYNNIFYIKNTKYADATVQILTDIFNRPTGNDKVLRLFANGITTNINLQAGVDQHDNGDNDFSCYLHKLIKYLREDGYSNGLTAQGWIVDGGYACNTTASPENLYDISTTNCYNNPIKIEGENSIGSISECSYTVYLGDGEQQIDDRVVGATQEDKAKIVGGLKYDSYIAITATASEQLSGDYNVTAIVDGRIVKIYTSPTTYYEDWSDNPAWCFLDFMTSVDGCGMKVSENDIYGFLSASRYYDELVNGKKRFTFNMIMDEKKSRQDWLDEILITCRSYRTYQRGLHGILVDKPENVSQVFKVKPDESIETWWQDNAEDVERLQIEYIDPSYEYTKVVAQADRVQLPGETSQFRNKSPLTKKISIYGIDNFEQASREAWFHLNKAQTCPEWIQYTTNKRALNRSIGDVVGVWNPITEVVEQGLDYKRYRVMSMTEPQENKITMVMQEYNPNLYTDTMGSVSPTINVVIGTNPYAQPPKITNIECWTNDDGEILVEYDASTLFDFKEYRHYVEEVEN